MGKRIVAYTYYIEWKGIGKKYYGVRYSKCLEKRTPEEDFWIYYKGSSKDTKFDRIKGTYDGIQPDVKRIHKIFYCKKELSDSQKQEIEKLKQEEIELESERDELDPDDFEEDYIEERTSQIEDRLLEIADEIDEINDYPDGDYSQDAIDNAVEDRLNDYSRNLELFAVDFLGIDYHDFIIDNDFIDKDNFIQGVS